MTDTLITSVDQVSVGSFVKFVGRDKSGKYSYTGEVVTVQKETKTHAALFEMLTFEGTMGFSFPRTMQSDDGVKTNPQNKDDVEENELHATSTKPKGWAKFKKNPVNFKEVVAVVAPVKTAKEKVFDLVAANPRKKEAALLKIAKGEVGGSESRLSSFIRLALAKK